MPRGLARGRCACPTVMSDASYTDSVGPRYTGRGLAGNESRIWSLMGGHD